MAPSRSAAARACAVGLACAAALACAALSCCAAGKGQPAGGGGKAARGAAAPAARAEAPAPGLESRACASDADCALTFVAEGGCCPSLCSPRAVTRVEAAALDADEVRCAGGRACPRPLCLPPRDRVAAACARGRCVGHAEGGPSPEH